MTKSKTLISLVLCFMIGFLLISCSCNEIHYKTYTDVKAELDTIYVEGNDAVSVINRKSKFKGMLVNEALACYTNYKNTYINLTEISKNTELSAQIETNYVNYGNNLRSLQEKDLSENDFAKETSKLLSVALENLHSSTAAYQDGSIELPESDYRAQKVKKIETRTLVSYLVDRALESVRTVVEDEEYEDFQQILFTTHRNETIEKLNQIKQTISNDEITTEKTYDAILVERSLEVYALMEQLTNQIAKDVVQPEPIRFVLNNFGDFFANFFDNFLVYPVGFLLLIFSRIFGGKYILGLFVTTLIVRTIGWPIYAKSNDMTLKMKLMEPEQAKLQEKYARRKDEESQRMMQMEMMQLYKKYKIGLGGCLMPFLQFPIFMAVFRAISRLPYTDGSAGSSNWVSRIDSTIFGVDLFADRTGGSQPAQLIGIIILCILVVGTQVLQQLLTNKKQKEQQEKAQADVPAYRRQSVSQNNQMANQMKIMMWTMTGMMGVFVFTSAAGLGIYWLIGNVYAIVQQLINSKTSEKRLEKLREKHGRY